LNKTDISHNLDEWDKVEQALLDQGYEVFRISAVANKGIEELMYAAYHKLQELELRELELEDLKKQEIDSQNSQKEQSETIALKSEHK